VKKNLVLAFVVLGITIAASSRAPIYFAAERFYESCQGGQMYFKAKGYEAERVVGCAEVARRIR